jgi:cell division FtsZ-interacting protein ZapD
LAQSNGWHTGVFEHPLTPTVASLLHLEHTAAELEAVAAAPAPRTCHQAAARLAAELGPLSPRRMGEALALEIRRWTEHLDGLAHRDGIDASKLDRLRSLLEQLGRRLTADWPEYFERLSGDPWLAAYRRHQGDAAEGFHPGPEAWAVMGPSAASGRLARWTGELAPMRTAAETGLRLMRDSLHQEGVTCHPEGYELALPAEPASGLVRVDGPSDRIPEFLPRGHHLRLRFLEPEDLTPATETVQATLGWFTL